MERVESGGRLCRESIWVGFSGQTIEKLGGDGNLMAREGCIGNFKIPDWNEVREKVDQNRLIRCFHGGDSESDSQQKEK